MFVDFFGFGFAVDGGGERDELGVSAFGGDAETKGILAVAGIVGLEFGVGGDAGGRAEEGGEFFLLFAEVKGVARFIPVDVGGAEGRGPFELKVAMEDGFDFEREFGLDFEKDEGAGFVHGDEEGFADGKSVAGIEDGGGFGAHGEGARERGGVEDAVFSVKAQTEIAKNFQRVDPGFDAAGLIAEDAGAGAGSGEKFPGADGASEFESWR